MTAECQHPFTKREKLAYGHERCRKCKADLLPPGRELTYRHSPRVTLTQGDRIHVKSAGGSQHSFKGVFLYKEVTKSGTWYVVAERQMWQEGKVWHEGTQAIRTVDPERVRRDDGFRARKRREEALA